MSTLPQYLDPQISLSRPLLFSILPLLFIPFLLKCLLTQTNKPNLPPSPPKLPIIGNVHQLGPYIHRSLRSLSQKHGPMMLLRLGRPTLVVSSAEAACEVMKTHDLAFADRQKSSVVARLLYNYKDISTANYGEKWRRLKSIFVLQLLNSKRVESFHSVRAEEVAHMIKKIKDSSVVNLSKMFTDLANDITCRAAFGRKYGEGESGEKFKELLGELMVLLGSRNLGSSFPWLAWINKVNGFDARVDRIAKEIDEFLERVIEERMNKMSHGGCEVEEVKKDFFDILLGTYEGETSGVSLDRDNIKALILAVFAAGTDTTATSLEWAMTETLKHPEVMRKLQNEVETVSKGKAHLAVSDLEKMEYLKAVTKETLRLHPPFPLLVPRVAREDVKVMGYDIPVGTTVMTNVWAIGRDPALWTGPDEFSPERFLDSSIDFKGQDFQLIPFGSGRRICPGISFAVSVIELVLANLALNFDWELPGAAEGEDLDMTESAGLTIHRRSPLLAAAVPRQQCSKQQSR